MYECLAYTKATMVTWYVRSVALVLFALGLTGFWLGRVPSFAELSLFQSFVYLIVGAVGLKLGFSKGAARAQARYALATGIMGYVLLAFGLTLPNFMDIFHLEVPEHLFHAALGLAGSFIGEHHLKQKTA